MREELVKVFSFEELNEVAKEEARNWWRRGNQGCESSSDIRSTFEEALQLFGLPTDDIEFSLSYSQGDGVAFYGQWEDLVANMAEHEWLDRLPSESRDLIQFIIDNEFHLEARIERNSFGYRYSHFNTMDVEVECVDIDLMVEEYIVMGSIENTSDEDYAEYYEAFEEAIADLTEVLEKVVQNVSHKLEEEGYIILEYYDSDEYIDEVLSMNNCEFTEDGEFWE